MKAENKSALSRGGTTNSDCMEEVYGEASYRFFKYYGLLNNVFPETSKYLTQRIIAFISHRELEGVSTPASRKQ